MRWTHLLMAWPLGAFVYTPARESEAFVLFVQVGLVPARVRRWRQHRTANDPG